MEQGGEEMVSEAVGAHLEFVTLSGFAPLRLLRGRRSALRFQEEDWDGEMLSKDNLVEEIVHALAGC